MGIALRLGRFRKWPEVTQVSRIEGIRGVTHNREVEGSSPSPAITEYKARSQIGGSGLAYLWQSSGVVPTNGAKIRVFWGIYG